MTGDAMKNEIAVQVDPEAREFFQGLRQPSTFQVREAALMAAATRCSRWPARESLRLDAEQVLTLATYYERWFRTGGVPSVHGDGD